MHFEKSTQMFYVLYGGFLLLMELLLVDPLISFVDGFPVSTSALMALLYLRLCLVFLAMTTTSIGRCQLFTFQSVQIIFLAIFGMMAAWMIALFLLTFQFGTHSLNLAVYISGFAFLQSFGFIHTIFKASVDFQEKYEKVQLQNEKLGYFSIDIQEPTKEKSTNASFDI